jgi:3-deoxy-D-manno-octulosonic-acid transferase
MIWHLLYRIGIWGIKTYVFWGSLFNKKLYDFRKGRKDVWTKIENHNPEKKTVYWFHCASLGEFEQAKPLIGSFKSKFPSVFILVTFFSPSGYNHVKKLDTIDLICYLPYDTKKSIVKFISIIKPQKVFIIRYEFWFHLINELKKLNLPVFLVSAVFVEKSVFIKWFGVLHRKMINSFSYIFLQDENSEKVLKSISKVRYSVVGDTRIDSVLESKENTINLANIEKWLNGETCELIGGSIYEKENTILSQYYDNKEFKGKLILVPHNIEKEHVDSLKSSWAIKKIGKYSEYKEKEIPIDIDILMIDSIGILKHLYKYAKIVCVGGGFGKGIHNTLEPAVWGKPLLFGENYKKFPEATWFVANGCAKTFVNKEEFAKGIEFINTHQKKIEETLISYFDKSRGATVKILDVVLEPPI